MSRLPVLCTRTRLVPECGNRAPTSKLGIGSTLSIHLFPSPTSPLGPSGIFLIEATIPTYVLLCRVVPASSHRGLGRFPQSSAASSTSDPSIAESYSMTLAQDALKRDLLGSSKTTL